MIKIITFYWPRKLNLTDKFFSHQISKFWFIFEMVPDDDQLSIEGSSNCNIKSSHIFPLGSRYEMAQPTNKQLRWSGMEPNLL